MISQLFFPKKRTVLRAGAVSMVESLEGRQLLAAAPVVTSVVADNRGEVIINLSRTVTGVSKSSVKLFTPGANGAIGDADDVRQPSQVVYNSTTGRITIKGKLEAGTGYRVRIQSDFVKSTDGRKLDGEYTGTLNSGDGKPGGNFAFQVRNDKSAAPIIRMSTSLGVISIRADKTNTPLTVDNFLNYANSGRYDSSFITRNIPSFIIQGGSLVVNSSNRVVETTTDAPVVNEFKSGVTSNTRGTIALAKLGGDPNSATNQFFFNLGDNASNLDNQNGGFTTFGTITNASGLAVIDAIAGTTTADLSSQIGSTTSTDLSTVPVLNSTASTALNPKVDLVIIRRVALVDKIAPVA